MVDYDSDLISLLDNALKKLPKLKTDKRLRTRLEKGINAIKNILPLLKNYIEQAYQKDSPEDITVKNIKTGIGNINTYIERNNAPKADEEINCTLGLLYETINDNNSSIYKAANNILEKIQNKEQEITQIVSSIENKNENAKEIALNIKKMEKDTGEIVSDKTSAELANIFKKRKDELKRRIREWAIAVVVFIFLFAALGGTYIYAMENENIENIIIVTILRLVLLIPISWGIIISSKKLTETIRLEEGYAHKEALLTLFVGYKNEIKQIQDVDSKTHIDTLIDKVLAIASKDPDYIFQSIKLAEEKHQEDVKAEPRLDEDESADNPF